MIYLASRSPRRQELLRQIGMQFELVHAEVDETPIDNEDPEQYVLRMAIEKALNAFRTDMSNPLLAADTSVICEGTILGKPENEKDFLAMFERLSDNAHQVMTAIAVTNNKDAAAIKTRVSVSEVIFRKITRNEALRYWQTGEPADKAGGYGIQGSGAVFIKQISGSYSGIMGLPLFETAQLLEEFNVFSL
ncbi:MAG: septum formation inhibitor Maf [Gammaproteobacteria bacterium]|nr:septum formation inhibitor Maf [Gammaproteobacteria bacterium]